MVNKMLIKLKRAYHRWCLKNAIAHHKCRVVRYNAPTNGYIVKSLDSNWMYHVFVDARGEIVFRVLEYA